MQRSHYKTDSVKVIEAIKENPIPSIPAYNNARDSLIERVFLRLQHNCQLFATILEKNSPENLYWKRTIDKPTSKLKNIDCLEFKKYNTYWYFEPNGDTVKLKIESGLWTDYFKDGTYSQLKFTWKTECDFQIEFLQSDNRIRKGYSKPGDIYQYSLLEKSNHFYLLSVRTEGLDKYSIFKLYY